MLGRLLNTAASTLNPAAYSPRNATQLESVTEEEHTSGLLFPDASLLRRSNTHAYPLQSVFNSPNASSAGAYDDRGGIELDATKDFRVIVAQNALGDRDACVLMDTRDPATEPPSLGLGLGPDAQMSGYPGSRHARTFSNLSRDSPRVNTSHSSTESSAFTMAADARRSPPGNTGAFSRARGRSSTLAQGAGWHDQGHLRGSADSNDSSLLNCIFGSSAFSYRGSSTKMHIISADEEPGRAASASPASRGPSMSRAYTTGSSSNFIGPSRAGDEKPPAKVTVLLTRMFSVSLPEGGDSSDQCDSAVSMYQESFPETGFPFPDATKRKKIRERKTPMYAVAITIQIPLIGRNAGRPVSRFSTQGTDSPQMGGMSCSLDSDYRWRGSFLDDSLSLAAPPASLDERIDLLVDHWDVVTRTLSRLERVARGEILSLLQKVDSNTRINRKTAKHPNMQRTNQTVIHLPPNIMTVNAKLRVESARSTRRISAALQTPYVVTGQSRWGVWREEGRSIVRALGDKEHSFFFLVLITAFLGNHTEWLNALGPEWYRRRHHLHQKAQQDSDPVISNRTVIVTGDKMTARRLVFLLSAFLPAKQRFEPLPSPLRPGTSTSMRNISQSPPTSGVPILRQESLRRAIERRSRAQRMNLTDNEQHHHRSTSVSSNETAHRSDDVDPMPPPEILQYRRGSDTRSIRTLGMTTVHARDARAKNTSVATTSTTTPSSTVPVPHFAAWQRRSDREGPDHRTATEGNDSLASENLIKNLQRSESSGYSSNGSLPSAGGRWGSLFSGLWSSRQEPATNDRGPIAESRRQSVSGYPSLPKQRSSALAHMARETNTVPEESPEPATSGNISIPHPSAAAHALEDDPQESPSTDLAKESPLKMSVRGDDGVVDVDLPLPGFLSLSSSGDSTVASPKKTRTSITSVDAMGSTHSSGSGFPCQPKEAEGPNVNVAGWLKNFHEDFLLQAVRPYNGLETDIKRAMQSESTPSVSFSPDVDGSERWVDVATTLVADVRNFTVKRLRLRRKAPLESELGTPGSPISVRRPSVAPSVTTIPGSQSTSYFPQAPPSKEAAGLAVNGAEERFVEEPVMDLDGTLIDALDRVLAQSGQSSIAHSRAPSPPRAHKSDSRRFSESVREEVPSLEVPRAECRKTVLGALEEVVRSVTAEHGREDVDGELGLADRERRRSLAGVDNTLREGVRRWLLDVEEAW